MFFRRRQDSKKKFLGDLSQIKALIQVSNETIVTKMSMIDFRIEDLKVAHAVQPIIKEHIEALADGFYESIIQVRLLREIIEKKQYGRAFKKYLENPYYRYV